MDIDLTEIQRKQPKGELTKKIREKKNSGARFSTARSNNSISHIAIWTGDGRERRERKINLTMAQGVFLYHLPFPNAEYLSISEIMRKAKVDATFSPEILDIVELLEKHGVIEAL
jgi:hypothetical protein